MKKLLDNEIREPLFEFLETTYGKVRIIEEKTMGRSRADVVMVTEQGLYGIEIKSDADTYARLAGQILDYDKYYDYNWAVVGSSHAMHIREHVPEYWGVITVEMTEEGIDFYILKKPEKNPKVEWKYKLKILWRPELAQLQEWYAMPKYKEKKKEFVIEKILSRIPDKINPEKLNQDVRQLLFERDYTTVKEQLAEYRKGEIQKKLEKEEDPQRKLELMVEQAAKGRVLTRKGFQERMKKYRRRK